MSFQGYLNTIRERTGKDAAGLRAWADAKGFATDGKINPATKAGAIVAAAKQELGLGHGHAMAIYALLKGKKED